MMAFFDLYYDLADQLNDTATDNLTRCKQWINWTLRDLVSMHDFEELQDIVSTTSSSYDFKRINPIKTASTIDLISSDGADTGITATIYGYSLSGTTRTYQAENVALLGTATASTTNNFSVIDRIETAATAGDVTISDGSTLATIYAGETKIANDFRKIIKIDNGVDVKPIHVRDRLLKFPGDTGYDTSYYSIQGSAVTFYNTSGTKNIYYQRKHPLLVNDYDETPLFVSESDIMDAAWQGWGLRFEDEAGADQWKAIYKQKLQEIIGTRIIGDDLTSSAKLSRRR